MTTDTAELSETRPDQLTAADRCDSCGAQAYVQVVYESGELLFCGHHFTKNQEKIEAKALVIYDERHRLSARAGEESF